MKAKKLLAVFVSMAIAATAVAGLAACGKGNGGNEGEACDGIHHIFSETEYNYNDEGHWHKPTCGHDFAVGDDFAAHNMSNGKCSVCGWEDPNYVPPKDDDNNNDNDNDNDDDNNDDDPVESLDVVLVYTTDSWATDGVEVGFYEDLNKDYDGRHFYLEVELTEGMEFYLYENLSKADTPDQDGNTRTWYNYNQLASGNELFNESAPGGYGTKNFVVRASTSYTFDFYIGTSYGGEPQPAHFDAIVTDGSDIGGGDIGGGGGDHSTWTQSITVHYYNTNGWATVNAYSWDSIPAEFLGGWPGTATQDEGDGWVKITYNIDPNAIGTLGIKFSNASNPDGEQTGDISLAGLTNNEAWVVNGHVYNTRAEADANTSKASIEIGSKWDGTNWTWKAMTEDASYTDGQKFTFTETLSVGQEICFHVIGRVNGDSYPKTLTNGAGNFNNSGENGNLKVLTAGTYTFTVIYNSGNVTITATKS